MADTIYGYYSGVRQPVQVKIDASTAAGGVKIGDMLCLGTAGYYQQCASGDDVQCVAMAECAVPSSDGALTILADFSRESIYRYPPASGSTVAADAGKAFDVGGAKAVDRAASADGSGGDGCLACVRVDTTNNLMHVRLQPKFSGV